MTPSEDDALPSRKVTITPAETALSACSGAILTSLFVTPLDVIKVKMQHNSSVMQLECEHAACSGTSSYSVMLRVARHEVRRTYIYFTCRHSSP